MSNAEARALEWLFSLADQERGVGWNPRASVAEQWKLGRTRALLDLAGAPDRSLRVVLVAGTKGKGSTSALLASILAATGARVGLYSKPHLQSYRERVRVDGRALTPDAFLAATTRMQALTDALAREHPSAGEPTTFEVTTALALDEFARAACDLAVVEVGLGGRLDATNALDPEVSVITSISYDHTAILGRTLGEIAAEKAGIMRAQRLTFVAEQRPAAARSLRRACRERGAECRVIAPLGPDDRFTACLGLAGAHQRQNASLSVAVARHLVAPSDAQIGRGLARLHWAGRFEVLDGTPTIVLDGAHNGASATALAQTLGAFAGQRPMHLVLGINRDKDARAVLRPLLAIAARAWATQTVGNTRALDAETLAGRCRRLGVAAVAEPDLPSALSQARAAASRGGGIVCVTGSLALVGQSRSALGLPIPEALW